MMVLCYLVVFCLSECVDRGGSCHVQAASMSTYHVILAISACTAQVVLIVILSTRPNRIRGMNPHQCGPSARDMTRMFRLNIE